MPKKFWPGGDCWLLKVSTLKVKQEERRTRKTTTKATTLKPNYAGHLWFHSKATMVNFWKPRDTDN